jgi:hypothetical protein
MKLRRAHLKSLADGASEAVESESSQPGVEANQSSKRPRREDDFEQDAEITRKQRSMYPCVADLDVCTNVDKYTEIEYIYSSAPIAQISLLPPMFSEAIQSSLHWKVERGRGIDTTECLTTLIPEDPMVDMGVTLLVGQEKGLELSNIFQLVPRWISPPTHAEP